MQQIEGKRRRWGITTGTCAAAAALAAAILLFEEEAPEQVDLTAPKGIRLRIPIAEAEAGEGFASCGVIKDAGDDPDVTNGTLVRAILSRRPFYGGEGSAWDEKIQEEAWRKEAVWIDRLGEPGKLDCGEKPGPKLDCGEKPGPKLDCGEKPGPKLDCGERPGPKESWYTYKPGAGGKEPFSLYLKGGKGIGIVTKAGLSCPPGMWAINPVPRRMIFEQVAAVCRKCRVSGPVYVTIEIPEGERLAEQTFNPRLGIVGGLSVLGTSGIVEPMSENALLETIRLEIRQKALEGKGDILLAVPGNYGERFAAESLGLSMAKGVKCSNHIGAAIDMAAEAGVERFLLVGHAGKLLKVAAGVMNTHSSMADGRMECLAAYSAACGASRWMVKRILSSITVDGALEVLEEVPGLREEVMEMAMERIHHHLKKRAGDRLAVEALLFTNDRGVLGMTPGAERMLRELAAAQAELDRKAEDDTFLRSQKTKDTERKA